MKAKTPLPLDGRSLTLDQVAALAGGGCATLSPASRKAVRDARSAVEKVLSTPGAVVYGINTGFGDLSSVRIPHEDLCALQRNLVLSHACGVGAPLSVPEARAALALRANALARGNSGIREETLELLIECLNRGVVPRIPEQGSVGASGDLAPLSHMAAVLIGEGSCLDGQTVLPARKALARAGLRPAVLEAKEGLSLINGTQVMTAILALVVHEARDVWRVANLIAACSVEALLGTPCAFDPRIHAVRPHEGQRRCAADLVAALAGSPIVASHRDCGEVQDAYSLRCIPQVHGAVFDALAHARDVLETEFNSATDNPLVFARDGAILSGGNFHGEPVALVADYAAIALAELGSISERRTDRLVNPSTNRSAPFLAKESGLHSGLMVPQYVAAALVSENKGLAHPASVDSIPTSGGKEDHVSMGTIGARKARRILSHVKTILAVEALCAAQALDLRLPRKPARLTRMLRDAVREASPFLDRDRFLHDDLVAVEARLFGTDFPARCASALDRAVAKG